MGIAISVLIAVAVTWVGIGCAFYSPYPIGFWVSSFAFGIYLLAACYRASVEQTLRRIDRRHSPARPAVAA
jgi:zinc/manganese transport system permease protein